MIFFGVAAIDALSELHKIGHPLANPLFRAFAIAAISVIVFHVPGRWRTR
jgi:hypothetical protein